MINLSRRATLSFNLYLNLLHKLKKRGEREETGRNRKKQEETEKLEEEKHQKPVETE